MPFKGEQKDKHNSQRMWVDGKYISFSHPLHKAGRYFLEDGDILNAVLNVGLKLEEGYVYIIQNPAWPDWKKIGMTDDLDKRLKQYQTSAPMRDYEIIHSISCKDKAKVEKEAHRLVAVSHDRLGEWFKISQGTACVLLNSLKENQDG